MQILFNYFPSTMKKLVDVVSKLIDHFYLFINSMPYLNINKLMLSLNLILNNKFIINYQCIFKELIEACVSERGWEILRLNL